jgi:hypothetical protein
MKKIIIATVIIATATRMFSQDAASTTPKVGWFLSPEVGAMFLDGSVGNTFGISGGVKIWKNRIKLGIMAYGRPGPTNSATIDSKLQTGVTYKGQSTLKLRADWGAFGGMIAPTFKIKNVEIDVPISFGSGIGGFYLVGEDRKTPDGARVSVWEDKLFKGEDASGGGLTEFGVRAFFPTKVKGMTIGGGLHYTLMSGWKTYGDPTGEYYNNKLRATLVINFGSH